MGKKKEKPTYNFNVIPDLPLCDYCNDHFAVETINVCEVHLEALDRVASRRKKK